MEGAVDGEPIQLATFILVINIALDTSKISQFALFDMYEELHVVPDHMILLLMFFETILFSV